MAAEGNCALSSDRNDNKNVERSIHSPFRVLGIALVVDLLGKGAKLSFRYPASPLAEETEDLFFRLPARQMAKLFRPKATLCGQPMTLSVGGTVFCCYAVLMEDTCTNPSSNDTGSNSEASGTRNDEDATGAATSPIDQLVLFSVIVALAPPLNTQNLPITGWLESHSHDYHHVHPNLNKPSKGKQNEHQSKTSDSASSRIRKVSPSFLSIRRVHVSLARLCKVLEREERRCRYVSGQTHRFEQIKKELKRNWLRQSSESVPSATNLSANTGTTTTSAGVLPPPPLSSSSAAASAANAAAAAVVKTAPSSANNSPVSISSTKTAKVQTSGMGTTDHRGGASQKLHRRTHSFSLVDRDASSGTTSTHQQTGGGRAGGYKFENSEEFAQEFLDTIMSLPPASNREKEGEEGEENGGEDLFYGHEGNLAHELIQVYHALARNDHDFPPTPDTLLSGRDAAVFLNRHLLVPIEAVSPPHSVVQPFYTNIMLSPTSVIPLVQPYQTLLFPHASASELLDSLTSESSGPPPRRLQLLLGTIHPQKSLADVAMETNIPLQVIIDMAGYMIEQGACIVSSVLTRSSQLGCRSIDLIPKVSLAFAQKFGDALPVFHLVAYLTRNGRTLGSAMVAWQNVPEDRWLLERLEASNNSHARKPLPPPRSTKRHSRQHHHHHHHFGVAVIAKDASDDEQENVVVAGDNTAGDEEGESDDDDGDDDDAAAAAAHHTNVLEDLLYRMTVWLCSHGILVPLEEYLVGTSASLLVGHHSGRDNNDTAVAEDDNEEEEEEGSSERKADSHTRLDENNALNGDDDDHHHHHYYNLYKQLLDAGCLEGCMSLAACSWQTNIDAARLRSFAVQHPRIRLVTRMPEDSSEVPPAMHHQ